MNKHLYDTFASRWLTEHGNTVWIYSDPHFSDVESYKLRGVINVLSEKEFNKLGMELSYDDFLKSIVNQADKEQIKKINSKVGRKDTVIFLGDIGNIECIKKIHGYKVLILGNHDVGASNYKRVITKENKKYFDWFTGCDCCEEVVKDNKLFDEVYEGPVMINDRVILSHEPIQVPEYLFNIHGHVHDKNNKGDSHHLNVCAEAIDYTPVNLLKSIKDGLLKDVPNIHRPTIDKATAKKAKKSNN